VTFETTTYELTQVGHKVTNLLSLRSSHVLGSRKWNGNGNGYGKLKWKLLHG